jgi:hypothetical protein
VATVGTPHAAVLVELDISLTPGTLVAHLLCRVGVAFVCRVVTEPLRSCGRRVTRRPSPGRRGSTVSRRGRRGSPPGRRRR